MLIYKVTNKVNGKIYVGQTVKDLDRRKAVHLCNAKVGRHGNYFHNAVRKYGSENFDWEILEECNTIGELNEREEYWIKELKTISPNGYNLMGGGNNSTHHKETIDKMSEVKKGKTFSEEHRKKMSVASKGKSKSKKHCENIAEARKGKTHSEKTRIKMSEAKKGKKRKPFSEEFRKNISEAKQGENHPQSKLTEADIIDIRKWYKEGMAQREIGEIKNVVQTNISCIVNYKRWKHI